LRPSSAAENRVIFRIHDAKETGIAETLRAAAAIKNLAIQNTLTSSLYPISSFSPGHGRNRLVRAYSAFIPG